MKNMNKNNWIAEGIVFGIIMLIFSSIVELVTNDLSFDGFWKKILIWIIGGLIFGLIMKYIRKSKK